MKRVCVRYLARFFPILFVVLQLVVPINYYETSTRHVETSIGKEFVDLLSVETATESQNEVEEIVEESVGEESSNEVIVDTIETHYEEPIVESYTAPTYSNYISIDSIYSRPLMKDPDGSYYYLDHNEYGVYDGNGVPFVDFRMDFHTRKTILYAHSSLSGNGPFQILQNYMDSSFYWNHPTITVSYNGEIFQYQIFSVYVSTADDNYSEGLEYFYRTSYSESGWDEAIHNYKNNSMYDTGVEVSSSDKIIILQTCSMDERYYEKYYRYNLLVMGKLI